MSLKNTLVLVTFFLTSIGFSQNCSKFYPFSEGTTMEITSYGKNQKVAATIDYIVKGVSIVSGNETATMNTVIKDKKGKPIMETDYEMICSNDLVSIDFKSMMSPQLMNQFKDMETEVSGTNLNLPNSLSVGQTLPDASIEIKINMSGIKMDIATNMTNREVIGEEAITTPAGTFDCYVITYSMEVAMSMGVNQSSSAKQWISEGVGMVKQEDYNKKGKITSSSLLTAFNK